MVWHIFYFFPTELDAMTTLKYIYRDDGLSKQLRGSICTVLCRDWDPLGIGAGPIARDAYRRHVPALFIMIVDGFTRDDIAAYVEMVEEEYSGRGDTPADAQSTAEALCALRAPYGLGVHGPPTATVATAERPAEARP
jgi:hypothetical protein